jgi:hypothetical protein
MKNLNKTTEGLSVVWTGAIRDVPAGRKRLKGCRPFGQELFATCSEGVRTLAERPNQKPWGGFESIARKANEGRPDLPFQFFRHRDPKAKSEKNQRKASAMPLLLWQGCVSDASGAGDANEKASQSPHSRSLRRTFRKKVPAPSPSLPPVKKI